MSGIALVYNRNGAPVQAGLLEGMMARLSHRGPDGHDVWHCADLALGCQLRWTTPEEMGQRQPLTDASGRYHLLFDGRLDNREELLSALALNQDGSRAGSDAALFLRSYARWGERCLERMLGEFAVALYDQTERCVLLARDPLGDRTLFYHLGTDLLVVASEAYAVLAHNAVPSGLDERTLAMFFAVRAPDDGSSFFQDVKELLPGQVIVMGRDGARRRRYWQPEPGELRYRDDRQYAEHYRDLLRRSVVARLRSVTPVGVMMSGGLDSTSVAALAADELARGGGEPLRTFSYIFDELLSCDERTYIDAFTYHWGSSATLVRGDDGWPLRDPCTWPAIPDGPDLGPYWRLTERIFEAARDQGVGVLLGGWFGDHLYSGSEAWLADLLWEGRLREALDELFAVARRYGWRATLWGVSVHAVVGRVLRVFPSPPRFRRRPSVACPAWLTDYAAQLLPAAQASSKTDARQHRLTQRRNVLGSMAARAAASRQLQERAGIEMRYPYRDRRVVEFMLSIPAHQFNRRLRTKYVLRNAMSGLLPEVILGRETPTSLMPLAARGLGERESSTVSRLLSAADACWPRFVRTAWLLSDLQGRLRPQTDGREAVVPWQCVCFELWTHGILTANQDSDLAGAEKRSANDSL